MKKNMIETPRIAFFGTSSFSLTILDYLEEAGLLPALIVTQPDKPMGRKLLITPPPVKVWAKEKGIEVIQPETLEEIPEELQGEWDVFVVVSYGKIIPKIILDLSNSGALNIHPSLLPKLRGPSPIQSSILQDMRDTGVTLMLLDEEMDHGPIVAQASVSIEEWPIQADILGELLAKIGAELLVESIIPWINGDIKAEPQNDEEATYCKLIKKEDGLIDLEEDGYKNYLKIQALKEWPQAYFFVKKGEKKMRVKIAEAEYKKDSLILKRVIPEGKGEMDYKDFMRGL